MQSLTMQSLIDAIRSDPKVGRGTCASIDECWDDEDLLEVFKEDKITTPEEAVTWARKLEGLFLEQGLNQRWGEDGDPQLLAWQEWNEV